MARKVTSIVCLVSLALFIIPLWVFDVCNRGHDLICGMSITASVIALLSGITLAALALIDYARRPR